MKIAKVVIGLLLLFAIIRASVEEGVNSNKALPLIVVILVGGGLVYIVYQNYFKEKKQEK